MFSTLKHEWHLAAVGWSPVSSWVRRRIGRVGFSGRAHPRSGACFTSACWHPLILQVVAGLVRYEGAVRYGRYSYRATCDGTALIMIWGGTEQNEKIMPMPRWSNHLNYCRSHLRKPERSSTGKFHNNYDLILFKRFWFLRDSKAKF